MNARACFECGCADELHDHHVVPRSLGGTRTVPLCIECHAKAHSTVMRRGNLTSLAMQAKRERGEYTGGRVRYGYRVAEDGVTVEPVEREQEVIRIVGELHAAGLSLRSIAARLEARGFKSRTGRRFNPKCVRSLVDDAAEHAA